MTVSTKDFNSTQTSASPLAGTAGYLDAILYACLVTGFNTKSISSISVTDNVATVTTSTNHGYVATDIIVISGANESVFNDEFRIKAITGDATFTLDITTANGSATGTISCKIAPLGWTREYTGTNKSVYRAPSGNRFYLRIDDSQAQYATIAMYETMSDVDTGTNKMGDVYWKKSNASSTASRTWYLVGNAKIFYLFCCWDANANASNAGYVAGEFNSIKQNDAYNTLLIGYSASAPASISASQAFTYCDFTTSRNSGHYIMRSFNGIVGAVAFFKFATPSASQMGSGTGVVYPNPVTNGIELYPVEIAETYGPVYRGRCPGLYAPLESTGSYFNSGDRTVVISNETYLAIKLAAATTVVGTCFFNISVSW